MKKIFQLFFGFILVPVNDAAIWKEVSFSKIKPNKVSFSKEGLLVEVNESASPLVYRLPKKEKITDLSFKLILKEGSLPPQQGFGEDFYMRLGLIAEGQNKLTGVKKFFAADWIKTLFSLVSDDSGLDKIYFFNVGNVAQQMNSSRMHPKSDLMSESVVQTISAISSDITIEKKLTLPLIVHGLWLSIDGDDTKSKFSILIKEIKLKTE